MSKVYLIPINQLNFEDLRKAFKKAKSDARVQKAASTSEGDKDVTKTS